MLDTKGITLEEVKSKYPKIFQTLGYDVTLGVDAAHKPNVISSFEMCINAILTLLFMKPGQYPSIPELGIDIESYMHEYSDNPTTCQKILLKLHEQLNRLDIMGISVYVSFDKTDDGLDALLVEVTGNDRNTYGMPSNKVIIGITYDKLNRLYARRYYI